MFLYFRFYNIYFNIMFTSCKKLFKNINVNAITYVVYKSHYEALNISKTATHKEIKDAYYRLSMIYHPDKNKGSEEAANIFRDITSAYEVLGNVRQRRLYDSGCSPVQKTSQYTTNRPFETMNTKNDLYKANVRYRDYNFDKWSQAHYSNAYQRHYNSREMLNRRKINKEHTTRQDNYNILIVMICVSPIILLIMLDNLNRIKNENEEIHTFNKKKKFNE